MGVLLIVFGATISVYTGWLVVKCAEYCDATRYEDIALKLYGRNMSRFTSVMILLTMLGFVIAYIVLLKTLLP
jgi:amino acid permease